MISAVCQQPGSSTGLCNSGSAAARRDFAKKIARQKRHQKNVLDTTERIKENVSSLLLQWTPVTCFDIREEISQQNQKIQGWRKRCLQPRICLCPALLLAPFLWRAAFYPQEMSDKVNGKARYCQTVAIFFHFYFFQREEIMCAEQQWFILGQSGSVGLRI